jgi:hypothetical protein
VIIHRFDTKPETTRASIAALSGVRAIASDSPDGQTLWRELALSNARAVHSFKGATLYEVKP